MMEARKHLVQYLHGFPGVKEYRALLVHVETPEDITQVLEKIKIEHTSLLNQKMSQNGAEKEKINWDCAID